MTDQEARSAARGRDSGLRALGESVIRALFLRRDESPQMRELARTSIRDARLLRDWRRARG